MTVLSNIDIINICQVLKIPLLWIGTKDQLKNITKKEGLYIVNLDNSFMNGGRGGSHWVACSTYKNYEVYFDPFGVYPPIAINKFMNSFNHNYKICKSQIQDVDSTYCGWLCIMFLHFLLNNMKTFNINQIINEFNKKFDLDDQTKNYYDILRYINRLIK